MQRRERHAPAVGLRQAPLLARSLRALSALRGEIPSRRGSWADGHVGQRNKLTQSPIRDDHVIVEQGKELAPCKLEPLIDRRRKPSIRLIGDDSHRHRRM
jgi:hypothetical protein